MEEEPEPVDGIILDDTAIGQAELDDELASQGVAPDGPDDNRLVLSDRLRNRVREYEREGTSQPFRHRIALIGAAELDEARPRKARSGAYKLLEAVYEHGQSHWLDPIAILAPLRELLFKANAPLGADRGLFYIMTRLARARISPAAFALHVIIPRMGSDFDWRRWKSRHIWLLDAIADILIELRAFTPWDGDRLGESPVLADVALCKYVGRPLCRLSSERFSAQESQLSAWADAWRSFTFASTGFLSFMRRTVLPCLYRLSGRIDLEQLAPIAKALSDLERTLGRRMAAMPPEAAELFLASAGLSDSFEARIEKRASGEGGGAYALSIELRGYAELASELSNLDAGPAILGRAAAISMRSDAEYLVDAASLVRALRRDEGAALARWHLDDFSKVPRAERHTYVAAVVANGGLHPRCPFGRAPASFERRSFDAEGLAASLGLDISTLRSKDGSPPDLPTLRRAYFELKPETANLYDKIAAAVSRGTDREWDARSAMAIDQPGPGFHELAIRSLIPGLGTGFSFQSLKEPSMAALFSRYGAASTGSAVKLSLRFRVDSSSDAGKGVDAVGRDAVRARVAIDLVEAAWRAITAKEGDPECGSVYAALGKEAAQARKRLADAKADAASAGDKSIRAQESRLALMDAAFESLKDLPPTSRDPRRFALAIHLSAYFFKQGDDAAFGALAGAATRYASDPAFGAIVKTLAADVAPGFMGVEQAALIADAIDALCAACASDEAIAAALASAQGDLSTALRGSSRLKGGSVSRESMDAALRRVAAYARVTAETAKWRDLLAKLETAETTFKNFSVFTSRSFLDAYYGDMGGICLSGNPELILRPGVLVCRLWDEDEKRIRGMCLFVYSPGTAKSVGISKFWYAFAFNPLRSLTRGMGTKELAILYLSFRAVAEDLSTRTGLPVLIPGIATHGVISNDGAFGSLVASYETAAGSPRISDASGFSVYYTKAAFADAFVAIDPRHKTSYRAKAELLRLGAIQP